MKPLLVANSAAELNAALAVVDIKVNRRGEGRTKLQTERYNVVHLLSSLPSTILSFPLILRHGDRPDFTLDLNGRVVGIEVTEAVPENEARSVIIRNTGVGPNVQFIRRAKPGEPPRSNDNLREQLENNRPSEPWIGNEPEQEWADAMFHVARLKAESAQKPGFIAHSQNWLLIYDNWPLPGHRHEEAASLFIDKRSQEDQLKIFDRIFVLDSKYLCELGSTPKLHAVIRPSAEA